MADNKDSVNYVAFCPSYLLDTFDRATNAVTLVNGFSALPAAGQLAVGFVPTSQAVAFPSSVDPGAQHRIIWKRPSDVPQGGRVRLRATPFDSAQGAADETSVGWLFGPNNVLTASPQSPIAVTNTPNAPAIGDLDGDGLADLAAHTTPDVILLLQQTDGTLAASVQSPLSVGSGTVSIAIADLDGDGKADLTTANRTSSDLTLYLQQLGGTLAPSLQSPLSAGSMPVAVGVGDLNGDGRADLAAAIYDVDVLTVYLQQSDGTMTQSTQSPLTAGTWPSAVAIGDLNDDGRSDLAATNRDSDNLTLYLQQSDGTLTASPQSPLPTGNMPLSIAIADLNGDRLADLVIGNRSSGDLTLYLQRPDGTLAQSLQSPMSVSTWPASVAAADLNGDGLADLAAANWYTNNLTLYLQQPGGTLTESTDSPLTAGTGPLLVATGDLNGDGKADLVAANESSNNVTLYLQQSDGTLVQSLPLPTGITPNTVTIGDLNGDGLADLATANLGSNDLTLYLQQSDGTLIQSLPSLAAGTEPVSVAIADFNGDGLADLAAANFGADNLTLYLQQSDGTLAEGTQSPFGAGSSPTSIATADVNGDGLADLVTTNGLSNDLTLYFNTR